jgi:hypothetical protein
MPDEQGSGAKSIPASVGKVIGDALGPTAENFGHEVAPIGKETGELVLRSVRLALGPVRALVWGAEQVKEWVETTIAEKLKGVRKEDIVPPNPRIAVPAMEALTYSNDDQVIREMFASLISSDMNTKTKGRAHLAFVQMIKEITPLEAELIKVFASNGPQIRFTMRLRNSDGTQYDLRRAYSFNTDGSAEQSEAALYNLIRLSLISMDEQKFPNKPDLQELESYIRLAFGIEEAHQQQIQAGAGGMVIMHHAGLYLTPLGQLFISICLPEAVDLATK